MPPSSEVKSSNFSSQRVEYLYISFQTFFSLLFWVPIFYSFQKTHGISDSEYFNIQSLYYFVFCFLEIPTGYFSDKKGYRKTLKLACFLMLISNISACFWTSYIGFTVHFLLIALGRSFYSGAASAYLFELLQEKGDQDHYKRIEGRARSVSLLARLIGWGVAGFMMSMYLYLPYILTAVSMVLGLWVASRLPILNRELIPPPKVTSIWSDFKTTSIKTFKNSVLLNSLFLGTGIFVLTRISQVNLYQPILQERAFSVSSFGWVMSIMTLLEAIGAGNAHRFKFWKSDFYPIIFSSSLAALSLIFISYSGKELTVLGFMIFSLSAGIGFPFLRSWINSLIPIGGSRATILSIESMINRATSGLAAISASYFVPKSSINAFLLGLSVTTLFLIFLLGIVQNRITKTFS